MCVCVYLSLPLCAVSCRVQSIDPAFHTSSHVFPVGYTATCTYPSVTVPGATTRYTTTIAEGSANTAALFVVVAADAPGRQWVGTTPAGVVPGGREGVAAEERGSFLGFCSASSNVSLLVIFVAEWWHLCSCGGPCFIRAVFPTAPSFPDRCPVKHTNNMTHACVHAGVWQQIHNQAQVAQQQHAALLALLTAPSPPADGITQMGLSHPLVAMLVQVGGWVQGARHTLHLTWSSSAVLLSVCVCVLNLFRQCDSCICTSCIMQGVPLVLSCCSRAWIIQLSI